MKYVLYKNIKYQTSTFNEYISRDSLNVETVPTFNLHLVGTVPTFNLHLVGTLKKYFIKLIYYY